jgi:acetamidase/formamidase
MVMSGVSRGPLLRKMVEVRCFPNNSFSSLKSIAISHSPTLSFLLIGFLTDHYPKATKACWDIDGIYCTSRHIPGVKFPGLIHPGLIGTAPR